MGFHTTPMHTFDFSVEFIHKAKTEVAGITSKFVVQDKNYPPSRPHEYRTRSAIVRIFGQRSHSFPRKQGDSAKLAGVNVRSKFSG